VKALVISGCIVLVAVQLAVASTFRVTPGNIDRLLPGIRVETTGDSHGTGFHVIASGDTSTLMKGAFGNLEVKDGKRTAFKSQLQAMVRDGEARFDFYLRRDLIPGTTFSFNLGGSGEIHLDDWFPEKGPYGVTWESSETGVAQGDTFSVQLHISSPVATSLNFGNTCYARSEIRYPDGEIACRTPVFCGAMMTGVRIEAREEIVIDFEVPTCSCDDQASVQLVDGCVEPGTYEIVCYIEGFRVYGLERSFVVTVGER